ncbi:MAG: hypothetical protein K1X53_10690 [Candidatus Sumerlaeaceae bacterium]|nr:hypothetical protein [Candidatus Sumerlaeaceae bacterium]
MKFPKPVLPSFRWVAAFVMLSLMATNAALEVGLLCWPDLKPLLAAPASCCEKKKRSCCEEPEAAPVAVKTRTRGGFPYKIVCTCKCCGPVCPMGEACTCNAPKIKMRLPGQLFLAAIGCTPNGPADYVPASLGFIFLPSVVAGPSEPIIERLTFSPTDDSLPEFESTPPTPPPRRAA